MMEVMALKMNPSITPKISRVVPLWILDAAIMVNIEVSAAPRNAPEAIPMPLIALLPMLARLMVTIAAPSPDPALIPMM